MSSAFEHVADVYDRGRPDYPQELFDAIESAMGQPLLWSRAVDVGAGTGIASRALAGRGAKVVAVDHGMVMLRVLAARATSRTVGVCGLAEALPVADGSVDLVTYAQSWHWADPTRALPEALRVLRPGGLLALFWNLPDRTTGWQSAHWDRVQAACPTFGERMQQEFSTPLERAGLAVWTTRIPWSREVDVDTYAANLRSRSYVSALGDGADGFVAAERARLVAEATGGILVERLNVDLVAARRP